MLPEFFNALSDCRSCIDTNPCADKFFETLLRSLQDRRIDFAEYFLCLYGRAPFADEYESLKVDYRDDVALYISHDVRTFKFAWNLPNSIKKYADTSITLIVHPPKTAGTSLVNQLEKNTKYPVWTYDYHDIPLENALKLPWIFENAHQTGRIFVRSHLTLSDQSLFFRLDSADVILLLIRNPVDMALSHAQHIARKCIDYIQDNPSIDSIQAFRESSDYSDSGLPDHQKSYSSWSRFSEILPAPEPEYLLSLIHSRSFLEWQSGCLQRYIGHGLVSSKCKNYIFLDSSMLDYYLELEHGILNAIRSNVSDIGVFGMLDPAEIRDSLHKSLFQDVAFYQELLGCSLCWRP
jgi:hypothetical protein